MYQWSMVARDNQKENGKWYGHSLWHDRVSNRYSIKDMSGDTPDRTDDGPLWIDYSRPVVIFCDDFDRGVRMSVPVTRERGGSGSNVIYGGNDVKSWIELLDIIKRKAVMTPEIQAIIQLLSFIRHNHVDLEALKGVTNADG
jgi:hypothetical protein